MNQTFEEILDKLKQVPNEYRHEEYNEAISDVVRFIERYKEKYNNGWIPCSERLPEENIEVLVSVSEIDGSIYTRTSFVQDGIWVIKKTPFHPTVIAWQPLPEPYKG